jgi:uncharacterized protein (TIGR02001 family)
MINYSLHPGTLSNAIAAYGVVLMSAGGLAIGDAARAADSPVSASANVALTTDYVFRYISQTNEEPAIQGGFDFGFGDTGIYLGTWASNVDFGGEDDPTIEIDFYGGWANEFANGLGLDVGVIHYRYYEDTVPDLTEIYAGLSYSIVSGSVYYAVDNEIGVEGGTDNYIWVEGGVEYDFGPAAIAATIGRFESDDFDDKYTGWSLGASTEVIGLNLDLTYFDTNSDGEDLFGKDIAGDRVVFTVSKEL